MINKLLCAEVTNHCNTTQVNLSVALEEIGSLFYLHPRYCQLETGDQLCLIPHLLLRLQRNKKTNIKRQPALVTVFQKDC